MRRLKRHWDDFLHLIYPQLCVSCEKNAVYGEELFCIGCEANLSITDFHRIPENESIMRMAGSFPFTFGSSMFRFYPGGNVQTMIHKLKYQGNTQIGTRLGKRYGKLLKEASVLDDLSYITYVPLHMRKLRTRGYNQSAFFARGLGLAMEIPVRSMIKRTINTSTQTYKSRHDRLESMMDAFALDCNIDLTGKHILLVDDVLTTGATLESCAQIMAQIGGLKLSFVTIGLAQ